MSQITPFSVSAILQRLHHDGVSMTTRDGKLYLEPQDKLTPDLLELCRQHKHDIICHLRPPSSSGVAEKQVEQRRPIKPSTVLKHCRCQDCRRLRDGGCTVGVLVPGAYPLTSWHYCAEYRGPTISPHVFVWHYDDVPVAQQAAGSAGQFRTFEKCGRP